MGRVACTPVICCRYVWGVGADPWPDETKKLTFLFLLGLIYALSAYGIVVVSDFNNTDGERLNLVVELSEWQLISE